MKAKEYAERFKAQGSTIEAAGTVVFDMLMECKNLASLRHVRSDEGMVSILNEISDRWKAFVRQAGPLCDGDAINPQGFEAIVERRMPEVYDGWMLSRR